MTVIRGGQTHNSIISDCWAAYRNLHTQCYAHRTVNYSIVFVDQRTRALTNTTEYTCHVLAFLSSYNRKRGNRYHLAHYMFAVKFRAQNVDLFAAFLQMAADKDWAALHLTSWCDCGM